MTESRSFDHAPESVALARRFATQAIAGAPADTVETVALMVSELATNCILHTDMGFDLTVAQSQGEIRVQATDRGGGEPTVRSPAPSEPSGRGLQIVDMLSTDWGFEHLPGRGKTVWFTVTPAQDSAAVA
jgi:serine/threonine-protein kinase RsbW